MKSKHGGSAGAGGAPSDRWPDDMAGADDRELCRDELTDHSDPGRGGWEDWGGSNHLTHKMWGKKKQNMGGGWLLPPRSSHPPQPPKCGAIGARRGKAEQPQTNPRGNSVAGTAPVSGVRFATGSPAEERAGLLGYVSVIIGPLLLDGIALRRSSEGRLYLAFPERRSASGRRYSLVRPVTSAVRAQIEAAVFEALGLGGAA